MNAGKSTALLQSSYNYLERGMQTQIYTAQLDDRYGVSKVTSRIGISSDAEVFNPETNIYNQISKHLEQNTLDCILIDEAQFLTKEQVRQLTKIVDDKNIPVLAYGLRTDFQGETFAGSAALLAWADKLIELKTVCHCGRKANFVLRYDSEGNPVSAGEQVQVGGNEKYESVCRIHFRENVWDI